MKQVRRSGDHIYQPCNVSMFFVWFVFSSGGWANMKVKLTAVPHAGVKYVSCVNLTLLRLERGNLTVQSDDHSFDGNVKQVRRSGPH